MKVNDETFELGGESTLLSLRNGGGKTVLVQMIMAPFVNARYRDLKDRRFENYFTSQTPTYILVEWLLDNDSSYALVGMGIKRSSVSSEEDSGDGLDIITFIHEYKEGNRYDIHSFPVTEKTERGFKVKSLSNIKRLMDDIKTDKNYIFDYFDLAVDSQRRKYFDNLKQYNINHREWESIIKRINLKESGLSDLFQDAKTVSGLVEKWFLPTVEDKLNDKDDKVKALDDLRGEEERLNVRINGLTGEKSSLKTKIEAYNKGENGFTQKYNIMLKRNIMGEYDQSLLESYEKGYEERLNKTDREYSDMLKEFEDVSAELPQKRKGLEDERIKKMQMESQLKDSRKDLDAMEKSIEEIGKLRRRGLFICLCNPDKSFILYEEGRERHIQNLPGGQGYHYG